MYSRLSYLAIVLCYAVLAGCMVGPNFKSPAAPNTQTYTASAPPRGTVGASGPGGKAQHFVAGADIPGQWWVIFHSDQLNDLIHFGLANSPNLAAAQATLRQAQETLNAQVGTLLFPAVTLPWTAQRQRFSSATFGAGVPADTFDLYNATVNVSYTLDVFGGSRRQIEALMAQVDYQAFRLQAAYLTLTANIVTTAINAASLQGQIEATQQLIAAQENDFAIVNKQFNLGGASRADVLSQQAQLQQIRATLPPLQQSLAQAQHALAVLIGTLPSKAQLPPLQLDQLTLPTQLPLSVPSLLVRQRPDVLAQEALLHAASAQIGVATANLFPQFTLTGNYGWTSNHIHQLFVPGSSIWTLGGEILQPVFNGGYYISQRRAAIAAYQVAAAQYRQTVLQAFQNVADTLRALEHDARTLRAQQLAEVAARQSLRLTRQQFQLGGVSYLSLLTAEQQYQQARISRIKAQSARFADTAALFQALGGGWWHHPQL